MSTVLWANTLLAGKVTSDEADKPALHRHADKLDQICRRTSQRSFLAICDHTDAEFNLNDDPLPPGMTSTNELMAIKGHWMDCADAVRMLQAALEHIRAEKTRFGLLRNDHDGVVEELQQAIAYAESGVVGGARFNFSVVM